jgi:hypothetical protein
MSSQNSPLDYIDYTSIRFPSDRITVADIRRAHPGSFDVEDGGRFRECSRNFFPLDTVIYLERLLARAAYEKAIGKPGDILDDRGLERSDCMKDLTKFYATYGVAKGAHLTEQLIREIESQAASQATGRHQ